MSQIPSNTPEANSEISPRPAGAKRKFRRNRWIAAGATLVVVGAGAWTLHARRIPAPDGPVVQVVKFVATEQFEKLSPEQQKPYTDALEKVSRGERREVFEKAELSDEDRERLFHNTRGKEMEQRVDAYFALATPAEKQKYLDSMLDEMQKRMSEFRNRPTTRPAGQTGGGDRPGGGGGNRFDPERMKKRMESTPPARQAKMAEFHAAMRKRMTERGITPPWERRT